jgi:hypothetical protein
VVFEFDSKGRCEKCSSQLNTFTRHGPEETELEYRDISLPNQKIISINTTNII